MKRLLVVSPHFPPINAPDMHRVRMSAPLFEQFGWEPHILTVDPAFHDAPVDPDLARSVSSHLRVTRTRALSQRAMRRIGIGNVALRALPHLLAAGSRLLAARRFDLVYFSTTMFPAMTLGRAWKRRHGVPYVVDMQDPWLTTYYEDHPDARRPPKYRLAHALDAVMEPWTMRSVDGVVAVSKGYIETLRRRYPWIDPECCLTLPFGASEHDFELAASLDPANAVFSRDTGLVHGVYIGRGGDDMARAARLLFEALRTGLSQAPALYERVRLHFVGTDYAPADRARKTIQPIAEQIGLADRVTEETSRLPYFQSLRIMQQADFLVVVGSDDAQYTASKIYPCVLARRPILAVLHERSSAATILRALHTGVVFTFGGDTTPDAGAARLTSDWTSLLGRLSCPPDTDWSAFEPYTAREMTRRQCELFDRVLSRQRVA